MQSMISFVKLTVLVLIALLCVTKTDLYGQSSDTFIYSLIIDKTASMIGEGDGYGDVIWFEVQEYLAGFVDMIEYNTKVVVYTFHGTIDPPKEFFINSAVAKQELRTYLRNIVPDGQNTAIYVALNQALSDLQEKYPHNPKMIYLITDGRDNASPQPNYSFSNNLKKFSAIRGEYDHLYYIDLRYRADRDDIELAQRDDNTHILPGFTRPVEIRTWHNPVPVELENGKAKFVQDFEVRGFELPDDFILNARLELASSANVNLALLPSSNISKSQLDKIEEGRYRLAFDLELLAGNIDESINIPVRLSAPNISATRRSSVDLSEFSWTDLDNETIYNYEYSFEYVVNFNPDNFLLNIEMNVPRVSAPQGGWK